jgi:hypothetical protein
VAFVFGYKLEPFWLLLPCQGSRYICRFEVVARIITNRNFASNEECDKEEKWWPAKRTYIWCLDPNSSVIIQMLVTSVVGVQGRSLISSDIQMDLNLRVHPSSTHSRTSMDSLQAERMKSLCKFCVTVIARRQCMWEICLNKYLTFRIYY